MNPVACPILCFAVMLLYPQTGSTHEMPEDGHARPAPEYMGSVSVGTYGWLAIPFLGPYLGPTAVSVFTSHGIYFRDAGVYTGISLELINFNYGIGYASHTKYYFKSKKIARPFIGVEIGGFSEFSALKEQRQDAYAGERNRCRFGTDVLRRTDVLKKQRYFTIKMVGRCRNGVTKNF